MMKLDLQLSLMPATPSLLLPMWRAQGSASGLLTLPAWLSIACATTGRTSQVSATSLVRGLGANAARARNVGNGWGLSVECARTQMCYQSESFTGAQWGTGTATVTTGQVDPAGGTLATRFASSGGQFSNYSASPGSWRVTSAWVKGVAGSAPYGHFRSANAAPWYDVVSGQWTRVDIVNAADAVGTPNVEMRNIPAGAGLISGATTVDVCFCQCEAGVAYPSSYLPNTLAATAPRAADVVTAQTSAVMVGGYYDISLGFSPNYASNETVADHQLLWIDANNGVYFKRSDRKLYLKSAGVTIASSSALTFQRNDRFIVDAKHTAKERRIRLRNATTAAILYDSGSLSTAAALSPGATIGILGTTTTTTECADLQALAIRRP